VWLVIRAPTLNLRQLLIFVWGGRTWQARSDRCGYAWNDFAKEIYGHSSIHSSSPFFFLLGAHLRVASTHYFNPVSDELVGPITLLFNYCNYLLCYCYFFLLKIFIAENEKKLSGVTRKHTFLHNYTCKQKIYYIAQMKTYIWRKCRSEKKLKSWQ